MKLIKNQTFKLSRVFSLFIRTVLLLMGTFAFSQIIIQNTRYFLTEDIHQLLAEEHNLFLIYIPDPIITEWVMNTERQQRTEEKKAEDEAQTQENTLTEEIIISLVAYVMTVLIFLFALFYYQLIYFLKKSSQFIVTKLTSFADLKGATEIEKLYFEGKFRFFREILIIFIVAIYSFSLLTLQQLSIGEPITEALIFATHEFPLQVLLSFLSSVMVYFIALMIDILFILKGKNPLYTFTDDMIAIIITSYVLYFFYNNTWITIIAGITIGLSRNILLKLFYKRKITELV